MSFAHLKLPEICPIYLPFGDQKTRNTQFPTTSKHAYLNELPAAQAKRNASLQQGTGAAVRRLSTPALPLSASFGTSLMLEPDEAEATLRPCIADVTQSSAPLLQLLYLGFLAFITDTFSICHLLIFLPWSLAVVLMVPHCPATVWVGTGDPLSETSQGWQLNS